MCLHSHTSVTFAVFRCFPLPVHCPYCGDRLIAPDQSEFVAGDEIRHHWACERCGGQTRTSVALTAHQRMIPK